MERDKPKKNRNQFDKLCRSCHGNKKRGDLKKNWIPFIKLHETLQEYPLLCVTAFGGLNKFKMVAVAMGTKVQKMLNSLQTSQSFAVMFPVTSTSSGTR
jgi:hypothetical protein